MVKIKWIEREPPGGSRLKQIVDHWERVGDATELFKSDDPTQRDLGAAILLREELRLWKLPRELVRDYLLLPAIERIDGTEAAAAVLKAPQTLEMTVDLLQQAAYRDATARARLSKPKSPRAFVRMAVMGAFWDTLTTMKGRSFNARVCAVGDRLGVRRGPVGRIVLKMLRAMLDPLVQEAVCAARDLLAEFDRENPARKRAA